MDFGYFLLSLSAESVLINQNVNKYHEKLLLAFCAFATIVAPGAVEAAETRSKTDWAEKVDPRNVLPEYPRPGMERADWQNLNGEWEYAILQRTGRADEFRWEYLGAVRRGILLVRRAKEVGEKNELW